jgi:hypothetical protein
MVVCLYSTTTDSPSKGCCELGISYFKNRPFSENLYQAEKSPFNGV